MMIHITQVSDGDSDDMKNVEMKMIINVYVEKKLVYILDVFVNLFFCLLLFYLDQIISDFILTIQDTHILLLSLMHKSIYKSFFIFLFLLIFFLGEY